MSEMITYDFTINGFAQQVEYHKEDIEQIFLPLLKRLTTLQKKKQRRILVYLVAPPAVGKSTLVELLVHLSKQDVQLEEVQGLGLDGFHYHQSYIESHCLYKDEKEVPMKDVKGCPETFDIDKLTAAVKHMQKEDSTWPIYDRNLHDVVEDQITIKKNIIVIEGNWLLLEDDKWKDLKKECDYSIFIGAEETLLKQRLIDRKIKGGSSPKEAEAFYEKSDGINIVRVVEHSQRANFVLKLQEDMRYKEEA